MRIVLYQTEIAQNLYAIIRTCACLNIKLEIIHPLSFSLNLNNPPKDIKRIIMDYKCEILCHDSWEDFMLSKKNNERLILLSPHSSLCITKFIFRNNDIIIFGRESSGVDKEVIEQVNAVISIPMGNNARSLNLNSSVCIFLGYII